MLATSAWVLNGRELQTVANDAQNRAIRGLEVVISIRRPREKSQTEAKQREEAPGLTMPKACLVSSLVQVIPRRGWPEGSRSAPRWPKEKIHPKLSRLAASAGLKSSVG
jgi:hypothetical protein